MAETIVADGFSFPEGPAFDREGNLYIAELGARRVSRISAGGESSVVSEMGGSPNGLAMGPDGHLYVANGGGRWAAEESTNNEAGPGDSPGLIQRLALDGSFSTLIASIDGVPLNSPNDLAFDQHGGFYFTDPIWPPADNIDQGSICYSTTDGAARRLHTGIGFPNGIGVSPDGSTLVICESMTGKLLQAPIQGPGEIGEIADYGFLGERSVPDGFCFDADGRVICAGHGTSKLHVFPPGGGEKEEEIDVDDKDVTNVCFGGPDFTTLFITESDSGRVAAIEWRTRGMVLFPDR